jgi:sulfur-oxidizing protein SoxB
MTKKEITIIQMNDTHGYMEEHWEHFSDGFDSKYIRAGGYPRIASYLKQVRKEKNGNVLFLDGGDTLHGTYPVVITKGKILIPLLNEMKVDAMTAHWEFAYGVDGFKAILKELNYPMLAINCYKKDTNQLVFDPYLIKEINGVKIGIIGIAATIVDKVMPKHFSEGLYFTLGNIELPKYIQQVKQEEGVDLVVVLSHLGFPLEIKLAEEVDGIDVLLSAHTHNRIYEPAMINKTIIIQSGYHGSFLGHLDLIIEDKKIIDFNHTLVVLDETVTEDKSMKQLVDQQLTPYREKLQQVWGTTDTDLSRYEVLESSMDNFLLESLLEYTNAQLAFSNGWRYGAPIPKGKVTENDLWNIIPVNPPVSTVSITGAELWDMMEENLERTFSKDPYQQMGGYVKRFLGGNLYFKIENPYGQRIQNLFVGGKPVEPDKVYHAVFVTNQGVPQKYGHNRAQLDIHAIDVLKNYLKKHETISSPLLGTIVAI